MVEGKLDPTIKSNWLRDLRSGEFRQGAEQLRNGGKYCCLGVLCESLPDVHAIDGGYYLFPDGTHSNTRITDDYETNVLHWDDRGRGASRPTQIRLQQMNDLQGRSFEEIADWIEENL